jgi:hypothetical protein
MRTDLYNLGSAMLTEMHGTIGCDPNCVKNYHGVFDAGLTAEQYRNIVGPPLTEPEWDAALAALAAVVPERCSRCGKALKHPVYIDGNVYGRVCVTKIAIVDFNPPQGFYIKPRSAFA